MIHIDLSAATNAISVGTGANDNFQLAANAGPGGGNGGAIAVLAGGNLVVSPAGVSVLASGNGNGGSLDLEAGLAKGVSGTVLINSSISINASGSGQGGTIVIASNSPTPLTIGGTKVINGVQGNISLNGPGGNGKFIAINRGGSVNETLALTNFGAISLSSGNNGSVTVSKNLGNANTQSIELSNQASSATSTGKISAKTLQANSVFVFSGGTQALSLTTDTMNLGLASKGAITVTNTSTANLTINTANAGATTIKSPGDISVASTINATGLTLQSTSKTNGTITSNGILNSSGPVALTAIGGIAINTIQALGKTGTVTLTAAGTGAQIDINQSAAANSKFVATAAKGSITAAGSITSSTSTVTLTSLNGISSTSSISGNTSVTIKSTGPVVGDAIVLDTVKSNNSNVLVTALGGIQNNGTVSAFTTIVETSSGAKGISGGIDVEATLQANTAGSKGAITLSAPAAGAIITENGNISAINNISITAAKGSISQGATIVSSSNGAVTLTAANSINQTGEIDAGTTATLKTSVLSSDAATNFLDVNKIITTNGAITVIGAGGQVSTLGDTIDAESAATKPAKATILIEDSNTKLPASNFPIVIAAGSVINTGGPGGGNINISLGAPVKGVVGTVPTNVTYIVNGTKITPPPPSTGPFFFSSTGITSSSPSSTQLVFDSENLGKVANTGQIIFTTGKFGATAIKINTNNSVITSFKADPPANAPATIDIAPAVHSLALPVAATPLMLEGTSGSETVTAPGIKVNIPTIDVSNLSGASTANGNALQYISGRPAMPGSDAGQLAGAAPRSNFAWISDTELASGSIPAVLHEGEDLGVSTDVSTILDMDEMAPPAGAVLADSKLLSGPQDGPKSRPSANQLTGGVSENVGAGKAVMLRRGSVVFAPTVDTLVHTAHGTISIAAKSLVLVIAYSRGVAVYDLDDKRQAAVKFVSNGKTIVLAPGRSLVLTGDSAKTFEEINPAQRFAYRAVKSYDMGDGRKVYTADFSAMSAAQAVLPLRQLMRSSHPRAQRVTKNMLKTTAILSQMQASAGPYQLFLRPDLSACAR